MARTLYFVFACLLLSSAIAPSAQPQARTSSNTSPVEITFGQSATPLYGPWKFTIGDSPIDPKTGKPLWAEPDFDDSKWENVDLMPKEGAIDPLGGFSGYVPGWTARGHAGYWGYAWYRIRVQARGQAGQPLAMAGPADVDDGYQAFADGELLGGLGEFTGSRPVAYASRPVIFRLPDPGKEFNGSRVLAFRFWMEPVTVQLPAGGGMHTAPVLGEASVVALDYQARWMEIIRGNLTAASLAFVYGVLALVAFSLILFDRSDPVYLWIGLALLAAAVAYGMAPIVDCTELWSFPTYLLLAAVANPLAFCLRIIVWWVWFGRTAGRWIPWVVGGYAVLWMAYIIISDEIFFGVVSHQTALRINEMGWVFDCVYVGLLAWIVVDGIRRRGLEGWLVLPFLLLTGLGLSGYLPASLQIPTQWFPFGVRVALVDVTILLNAVVIALLLLRRLLQSLKRQREMALDVKSAQEVQQVILPEQRVVLPGLEIESEYRPAREVGGDFFQIIPNEHDGSLLIVAGDVAGKGLKAGMLVALLVGAIRTAAEEKSDPAEILAALNRRLLGRGDARATCLALRIERDGAVRLANAGHLPPYLNGESLEVEGSLPLGLIEKLDCSELAFQLSPGDRLLLVSDGVPEATDEHGKLFGFERVLELVRTQPSAARVAETAQAYGQEDDISVIAVTRIGVAEPALA
jgi:hypothetical protein